MKKILLILVVFIIFSGCVSTGQSGEAPRPHSRSYSGCTTNWCGSSWGMQKKKADFRISKERGTSFFVLLLLYEKPRESFR